MFLFISLGWIAVPVFFALSGYLITKILWESKYRDGYFRVFYARRALRVFPLYYLVLFTLGVSAWLQHWHWDNRYLAYFGYLQNFSHDSSIWMIGKHVELGHLWSLAVEEHFYFVWPIVVWFCSTRRMLLRVCCAILIFCFAVRVCWPLFHWPLTNAYCSTFTRIDGIAGGAVIAMIRPSERVQDRLRVAFRWAIAFCLLALCYRALTFGRSMPWEDYTNVIWMIPVANLFSAALLFLLLKETTLTSRICSYKPLCALGRLSYPMYMFHALYMQYFANDLVHALATPLGVQFARIVSISAAFLLTWLLAMLAYKFIEAPAMKAKRFFQYGRRVGYEEARTRRGSGLPQQPLPT